MAMRKTNYDGLPCPVCGSSTRRMFVLPKSQKGRVQHPRWWVCERGHKIYRKKGWQ